MAKSILFHGTTYENYLQILKDGFDNYEDDKKTWNCSIDNEVYFFDVDKTDNQEDDLDYRKDDCINKCFQQAQITASLQGTFDNRLIVLQYEIDSEFVHADTSCENCEEASTVDADELAEHGIIKNIFIDKSYNPHLRFFYISGLLHNDYFNRENFTDLENEAMTTIANTDNNIWCDLVELNWEKYTPLKLVA